MSKRKLTLANNPLFSGPSLRDRESIAVPYRELSPEVIDPDPDQPRKEFDEARLEELAESIKLYGVLSPLLVRPGRIPGRFDLIAGERRLRAARRAGLAAVPVIVKGGPEDEGSTTLAVQLVENLQRSELSPFERAQAIAALRDGFKLSIREIAERLGVSKSLVHRSLEVLDLPPDLLDALRRGESESKVLLLARIADPAERAKHLRNLSLASRAELEREVPGSAATRKRAGGFWEEDARVAEEIQRTLGVKVSVRRNRGAGEQGKLIVEFYSNSDLQLVFQKLVA